MASFLDKAMLNMNLEEEEEPFALPDLPDYCSNVRNKLSLMGRLLNPDCQNVSDLIREMPRKWQLYDRVQGIALSRDRFQFIFRYEHDLEAILKRGAITYQNWSMIMQRWVPNPPSDYLQFLDLWVQMRNIPVNHRTELSIAALGEFAGPVIEVAFDATKQQVNIFERVKVHFDVSKPLRLARKVKPPGGEVVNIIYDYERVQLRCHICQRLTHEKTRCPFKQTTPVPKSTQEEAPEASNLAKKDLLIKEADPLFGVVKEAQVGINPMTGRPKRVPEVLEDLRQYLLASDGPERLARQERVKKSLLDLENDPLGQKTMLRLEPMPTVTPNLDKGKGIVFDFRLKEKMEETNKKKDGRFLMKSAIQAGTAMSFLPRNDGFHSEASPRILNFSESMVGGSTGFRTGFSETSSSGTIPRKTKPRKRPGTYKRKPRSIVSSGDTLVSSAEAKNKGVLGNKRKANEEVEASQHTTRSKKPTAVPKEGLSKC